MQFENLRALREGLVGYSRAFALRRSGLSEARFDALERGDAPSVYELEVLGALYGLDPDLFEEAPIEVSEGGLRVLALLDEFQEVSSPTKAKIIALSNAARDLVELRLLAGEQHPWESFREEVHALAPPEAGLRSFEVGRRYAREVRQWYGLEQAPIRSVRDWVTEAFPQISLLYAELDTEIAGITFADERRGAVIVLNLKGKNENPCVRRFSLLHELCHLLVDSDRHEPLASLSGFLNEQGREREQRANAFAMRMLCPEEEARSLGAGSSGLAVARELVRRFGVHYSAVRLYLRNLSVDATLPGRPPANLMAIDDEWARAEEPAGLERFPLKAVLPERRTIIARYAAQLYSDGVLRRDRFARYLGVTPAEEVELVLDWLGLDQPRDGEDALVG